MQQKFIAHPLTYERLTLYYYSLPDEPNTAKRVAVQNKLVLNGVSFQISSAEFIFGFCPQCITVLLFAKNAQTSFGLGG
jgi:hypothetical protein